MLRFRVGHHWQRETLAAGGPRDAFALELEGLNLLPGANDEPLVRIVSSLVDTVASLVADGERAGQLSLEDVHLELCLWRTRGEEISLSVIDLSQPPRQVRAPIAIDLPTLVEATVKCARGFLRDVAPHRAGLEAELVSLERRLKQLTSAVIDERPSRESASPWSAVRSANDGLGFSLRDDEGRTLAWSRKTRAGLPPLLFDGELTLPDGTHRAGHPFLSMMGLARAAAERKAEIGGQPLAPEQVFLAGLELCLALRARNPSLSANPYVEALQVRCVDGLTALRQPVPDTTRATIAAPRATPGVPLARVGDVRRVSLEPRWSRPVALGEDGGRLQLGKRWVVVSSPHAAHAFTKKGETVFRHLAPRGIAIDADGASVQVVGDRLMGFSADRALWLKDHDHSHLGPAIDAVDDVKIVIFGRRLLSGLSSMTGRELWRFEPQRAQSVHVSRVGARVLVGTDGGTLYGVDAHDGTVRFRVKAGLPVVHPAVGVRNRALVVLNRGEHSAVFACDALASGHTTPAGAVTWTRELILSMPTRPVAARGRTWLGGARDGRTVVVCLGPRGQLLWEKSLNADARTLSLLPFDGGVIACDARGAATRLLPDGSTEWVLGSSGDELNHAIAPFIRRKTLVVPGPVTRLVHPAGGRVLAELPTGARVLDLVGDARLNLYVLREPGTLETFVPGAALSLVKSPR